MFNFKSRARKSNEMEIVKAEELADEDLLFPYNGNNEFGWKILERDGEKIAVLELKTFMPKLKIIKNGIEEYAFYKDHFRNYLTKAIDYLQSVKRVSGLVIDVRDNGGGIIEVGDSMIQLFNPEITNHPTTFRMLDNKFTHSVSRAMVENDFEWKFGF